MNCRNLTRGLAAGKGEPLCSLSASEETLVPDLRSGLTLAQLVERQLLSLLRVAPLSAESREKFKPTAVGQMAQGVTRFAVVASITPQENFPRPRSGAERGKKETNRDDH